MAFLIAVWSALSCTAHSPQAPASDHTGSSAATAAALRYVRDDLYRDQGIPPANILVEAHLLPGETGPAPPGDSLAMKTLASSLGLKSGRRQDYVVCGSGPGTCRLKGAMALVSVSRPAIEGDSARLIASVETEHQGTLHRTTFQLILCRSQEGWAVSGKRGRSVT